MGPLAAAAMESYSRAYPLLVKLHMVQVCILLVLSGAGARWCCQRQWPETPPPAEPELMQGTRVYQTTVARQHIALPDGSSVHPQLACLVLVPS